MIRFFRVASVVRCAKVFLPAYLFRGSYQSLLQRSFSVILDVVQSRGLWARSAEEAPLVA